VKKKRSFFSVTTRKIAKRLKTYALSLQNPINYDNRGFDSELLVMSELFMLHYLAFILRKWILEA
jgi:hypothetical protein